jgi:hypothetical protein
MGSSEIRCSQGRLQWTCSSYARFNRVKMYYHLLLTTARALISLAAATIAGSFLSYRPRHYRDQLLLAVTNSSACFSNDVLAQPICHGRTD